MLEETEETDTIGLSHQKSKLVGSHTVGIPANHPIELRTVFLIEYPWYIPLYVTRRTQWRYLSDAKC